jgi:hypothetical protein
MTEPKALSQEQRVELVAKAKAATPGPWRIVPYDCGDIDYLDNAPMVAAAPELDCAIVHWEGFVQRYWRSARGEKEIQANAAFIAAANPSTILSYDATVQALTVERDAALEGVKALADEIDGFEVVGTLRGTAFASGWEAAQRFISGHVRALLTPMYRSAMLATSPTRDEASEGDGQDQGGVKP